MFHRVLNTPLTSVSSEHILIFWEFTWNFRVVFFIIGHKMHKVCTELYVGIHFLLNYRIVKMISGCQSTYRFLILGMIMWWSHLKSLWQSNWLLVIFISVVFVWSLVHQVTIVTQLFKSSSHDCDTTLRIDFRIISKKKTHNVFSIIMT